MNFNSHKEIMSCLEADLESSCLGVVAVLLYADATTVPCTRECFTIVRLLFAYKVFFFFVLDTSFFKLFYCCSKFLKFLWNLLG